jgi:ribosomal protein L37AE/L43A
MSAVRAPAGKSKLTAKPFCLCGNEAVRRCYGKLWSCQSCLDRDKIVQEMHERAERKRSEDILMQP